MGLATLIWGIGVFLIGVAVGSFKRVSFKRYMAYLIVGLFLTTLSMVL